MKPTDKMFSYVRGHENAIHDITFEQPLSQNTIIARMSDTNTGTQEIAKMFADAPEVLNVLLNLYGQVAQAEECQSLLVKSPSLHKAMLKANTVLTNAGLLK